MFSCEFPKFLRTPVFTEHFRQLLLPEEMLRIHVNLSLMFGLGKNFSEGILVCMLLSLFSVDNNIIENIWKRKFTNLMSMHFLRQQCFYSIYKLAFFIDPSLINTRRQIKTENFSNLASFEICFCKSQLTTNM